MTVPRSSIASVFLLGLGAQVSQVLVLREVLGQVEGSEVAVGVTLAAWLLGGAAGALLGARLSSRPAAPALAAATIAAAAVTAAAVHGLRLARGLLPLVPGQSPGVLAGLGIAAAGGLVAAPAWGFAFPLAARLLGGARAYALEAAGALAGGATFTFLLAPLLTPPGTAALLLALAALPALRVLPAAAVPALLLGTAGLLAGDSLERASREAALARYLPGLRLLACGQTARGPVDVLGLRGQVSAYRYGHLDFTSPDPEGAALRAHLPLAIHPAPRRLFLAGGGPGVLREALGEPIEEVLFAEPDPGVVALALPWLDPGDRGALSDPRVRLLPGDPRAALRGLEGSVDVIAILGLEPSTAASNRFFTEEFFREAARALRPGGVLFLSLPGGGEYLSPALLRRNALVLAAARASFPRPAMVPGEDGALVAVRGDGPPSLDPGVLAARFLARGVRTGGMAPGHFDLVLPEGDATRVLAAVTSAEAGLGGERNSDARPAAFHRTFEMRAAEEGLPAEALLGPVARRAMEAAAVALLLLLAWRGRPGDAAVASSGLAGMGLAVVVLFGYQSCRGDLYGEVGLLGGTFMAGLAAGSCLRVPLPALDLAFAGTLLLAPLASGTPAALFALAAAGGALTGAAFPAAVAAGGDPPRVYALDLAGSALGALVAGAVFVPAEGVAATCVRLAALKAASALAGVVARHRPGAGPAGL